jgi:peptidoglycan/LPS O-acetylase OafA/YrhL
MPVPHGVDIFFVISGFLIGKSFINYLERNNNRISRSKTLTFYARTALRILPNYLFILLVNYILVRCHVINGDTEAFPLWRFATFTQNLWTPFWGFYWESYSLPVQWWFYIFFPLLLTLLCLFSEPKKSIPWLCLFFIIASIAFRLSVADQVHSRFDWDIWIRKTVVSRTDNIYLGVLAAWVMCYFPRLWNRYAVPCFILGLVIFAATRILPRTPGTFYYDALYLTISALAIALWFPLLTRWKSYKTLVGSFVSRLSVLSYAMFLTNLLLLQVLETSFPGFISRYALAYPVYWVLVFVATYVLYLFVEKPFAKLRDKIL